MTFLNVIGGSRYFINVKKFFTSLNTRKEILSQYHPEEIELHY